ncbi:MAG: DUF521 domain-containing protein [Euryarchaeota archaeon]|nr:DUF521 domain-containing protein [Euryarchaeota archaeon]
MYLTREEERVLNGEQGSAKAKMLRILVKMGEVLGAERLIPVSSAQISGVSYRTIGDAGLHFLRSLKDASVVVPATLNPIAFDEEHIGEMEVDDVMYEKQMAIVNAYVDMGVKPTMTCTPYYFDNVPRFGEHIAWAESSAVIYANSIIGARTNREGSVSALASAITGKTPEYGLHIEERRKATHIIEVDFEMRSEHFPLLGLYIGREINGIPYLRVRGDEDDFKLMGAAMAASGSIAMYHVEGFTPEYRGALHDEVERITVEEKELADLAGTVDNVELVAIGCPHVSGAELRKIAEFVKGRKKRSDVELWIFAARSTIERHASEVKIIEEFGGVVMKDTCVVVSNAGRLYKRIATNSGKAALYLRKSRFGGAEVMVRELYTLLRSVIA